MLATRIAKVAFKQGFKPSLAFGILLSAGWLIMDVTDGASDRLRLRKEQATTAIAEPADSVMVTVTDQATKLWASIESNPGPSLLALSMFALTVVYHKYKGRTIVAALKAGLLKEAPVDPQNPLITKMIRQAAENQMLETFDKLEKRQKALPNEIANAHEGLKQAVRNKQKADEAASRAANEHIKAQSYFTRLQTEFDEGLAALVELEIELAKA